MQLFIILLIIFWLYSSISRYIRRVRKAIGRIRYMNHFQWNYSGDNFINFISPEELVIRECWDIKPTNSYNLVIYTIVYINKLIHSQCLYNHVILQFDINHYSPNTTFNISNCKISLQYINNGTKLIFGVSMNWRGQFLINYCTVGTTYNTVNSLEEFNAIIDDIIILNLQTRTPMIKSASKHI